jgi:tetratricopeptide (TPR) repeat protein
MRELRRISDLLGIEPEYLGLAASMYVPKTLDQIEEVIKRVWSLLREERIEEAHNVINHLMQNLQTQITSEDPALLRSLAHAYHAKAHVISLTSKAKESGKAIPYYREMEEIARISNDQTSLNIALTYQGDMYRRMGDIEKAIAYLKAARDTTPQADTAARGNAAQLLARASLRENDMYNFERAMAESEELASTIDPDKSSTQGHFNLGTVYEEYGRSYAELGQMQKALDYLARAESHLPPTKLWKLLLKTARALALVKGGELREGIQLATEAAIESRATGNQRYLDRVYVVDRYLDDIQKMRRPLQEALYGENNVDI